MTRLFTILVRGHQTLGHAKYYELQEPRDEVARRRDDVSPHPHPGQPTPCRIVAHSGAEPLLSEQLPDQSLTRSLIFGQKVAMIFTLMLCDIYCLELDNEF